MFLHLILFTGILVTGKQINDNDDDECATLNCNEHPNQILCLSSLTQDDCKIQGKYIVSKKEFCGCCPGCQGGNEVNDICMDDIEVCAPGLECNDGICKLDKSICSYTFHLPNEVKLLPTCDIDGTFAAVQCKGDRITGRCFCYAKDGRRIFGWSWWKDAHEMTCTCSRLRDKLKQQGNDEYTLHCDQMGNFEPLQCTNGICWCSNSTTGELLPDTVAVPEAMWTLLPCYNTTMGTTYLRQCESSLIAQNLLRKALTTHGTTQMEFNNIVCDYDGAFGIYQNKNGVVSCQWRDGKKLLYTSKSNEISKMNCNCARDKILFPEAGIEHRLDCEGNGNYRSKQYINKKVFCVDGDGYAVNEAEETLTEPNCSDFIYYEVEIKQSTAENEYGTDYYYNEL